MRMLLAGALLVGGTGCGDACEDTGSESYARVEIVHVEEEGLYLIDLEWEGATASCSYEARLEEGDEVTCDGGVVPNIIENTGSGYDLEYIDLGDTPTEVTITARRDDELLTSETLTISYRLYERDQECGGEFRHGSARAVF